MTPDAVRLDAELIAALRGRHYVAAIPVRLPPGEVLVHNQVIPARMLGERGFRAWTMEPDERLVLCGCDWAGVDLHGHPHYRVRP